MKTYEKFHDTINRYETAHENAIKFKELSNLEYPDCITKSRDIITIDRILDNWNDDPKKVIANANLASSLNSMLNLLLDSVENKIKQMKSNEKY